MPEISLIIRTHNEERWIRHCLQSVFNQDHTDFEVILVDNQSTDHTVQVAKRFPLAHVTFIDHYLPGLALNKGIELATGRFIVCLSAHCVPLNAQWLSALRRNFAKSNVAGVYGRQIPVAFSDPVDKRDLMIVFGLDRRVQIKDYFFHNANSMIRRDLWEKTPFDPTLTNIEDRVWGKAMIEAGYRLIYEPKATVFHHHGLHQGNDARRAQGVISIIESVEDTKIINGLPDSMHPAQCHVTVVVPVLGPVRELAGRNLLVDLIHNLQTAQYIRSIYVCSENEQAAQIAQACNVQFIQRPQALLSTDKSIEDVLKYCLETIEQNGEYPETLLYANPLYPFRPPGLWDELIRDAQFKGLDTLFPSYPDYSNTWWRQGGETFTQVGEGLMPRVRKEPLYRALYGLGCLTSSSIIRTGKLVGGRIGILPITDLLYSLRYTDQSADMLAILEQNLKR